MKQIVLDTETTGLDTRRGHRVIEIGCVEIENRRVTDNCYHTYINPMRPVDPGALEIHGITDAFLADKPLFEDIVDDFIAFIDGAELLIHNAAFDVGFLDYELGRLEGDGRTVGAHATVLDTLEMARKQHPGMKNTLDALCKRYEVDNSARTQHGALLDAKILAEVYLAMTGGQIAMTLDVSLNENVMRQAESLEHKSAEATGVKVIRANNDELEEHRQTLERVRAASGGVCLWDQLN